MTGLKTPDRRSIQAGRGAPRRPSTSRRRRFPRDGPCRWRHAARACPAEASPASVSAGRSQPFRRGLRRAGDAVAWVLGWPHRRPSPASRNGKFRCIDDSPRASPGRNKAGAPLRIPRCRAYRSGREIMAGLRAEFAGLRAELASCAPIRGNKAAAITERQNRRRARPRRRSTCLITTSASPG